MRKHHCSDGARGLLSCKRATLAEPRAQSAVLSWLLDWRLPHERGCEVARDLARRPRSCQPTAHGEPQAASRSALALTAAVVVLTALVSWWLLRRWKAHKALHRELMQREETRMRAARELPRRAYTLEDLQRFDGSDDDRPIALVCNGDVFNVSDARDLYGGEGCYAALSGKDASRLLAKGILRDESAAEAADPLAKHEEATLRDWHEYFSLKYPKLGPLELRARPEELAAGASSGSAAERDGVSDAPDHANVNGRSLEAETPEWRAVGSV